jgi:hypothetical protein
MEQSQATLEPELRSGIAGRGKHDPPKTVSRFTAMVVVASLGEELAGLEKQDDYGKSSELKLHQGHPLPG